MFKYRIDFAHTESQEAEIGSEKRWVRHPSSKKSSKTLTQQSFITKIPIREKSQLVCYANGYRSRCSSCGIASDCMRDPGLNPARSQELGTRSYLSLPNNWNPTQNVDEHFSNGSDMRNLTVAACQHFVPGQSKQQSCLWREARQTSRDTGLVGGGGRLIGYLFYYKSTTPYYVIVHMTGSGIQRSRRREVSRSLFAFG